MDVTVGFVQRTVRGEGWNGDAEARVTVAAGQRHEAIIDSQVNPLDAVGSRQVGPCRYVGWQAVTGRIGAEETRLARQVIGSGRPFGKGLRRRDETHPGGVKRGQVGEEK